MGPAAARTLAAAIRLENDSFCGTSHEVPTLQLFNSSLGASRLPVISGLRRSNSPFVVSCLASPVIKGQPCVTGKKQ